jgi:hypothetical protein
MLQYEPSSLDFRQLLCLVDRGWDAGTVEEFAVFLQRQKNSLLPADEERCAGIVKENTLDLLRNGAFITSIEVRWLSVKT